MDVLVIHVFGLFFNLVGARVVRRRPTCSLFEISNTTARCGFKSLQYLMEEAQAISKYLMAVSQNNFNKLLYKL